ncbi:MAG UNVERIFIED_CONTAM: hypothetical protein LVR18_24275 [Planctomycetaceae bacterium]
MRWQLACSTLQRTTPPCRRSRPSLCRFLFSSCDRSAAGSRLAAAVFSAAFHSAALFAQAPTTVRTIAVGTNPESVCRGFNNQLFVTLINGEEPGDGTIVRLDGDKPVVFARGFNAPKGIVFVGGLLVTADETTLWTIDSSGRTKKLAEVGDFPTPVEFLNDVAASLDGKSVLVAEMTTPKPMFDPSGERKLWNLDSPEAQKLPARGRIYRVTLEGRITEVIPPATRLCGFQTVLVCMERRVPSRSLPPTFSQETSCTSKTASCRCRLPVSAVLMDSPSLPQPSTAPAGLRESSGRSTANLWRNRCCWRA